MASPVLWDRDSLVAAWLRSTDPDHRLEPFQRVSSQRHSWHMSHTNAAELTTMNTDFFVPAVARGAGFLDGIETVWRPRIDLERLNLGSGLECVLGQLYGSYTCGVQMLDVATRVVDFGFTIRGAGCTCCILTAEERAAWEALTQAWRLELSSR